MLKMIVKKKSTFPIIKLFPCEYTSAIISYDFTAKWAFLACLGSKMVRNQERIR